MLVVMSTAGRAQVAGWLLAAACLFTAAQRANAQTLVLQQRIGLPAIEGRIDHMAVDVEGSRLFVAALGSNSVEVVDFKAVRRVARITGLHEPQGVAYWTASRRLFVANGSGGGVQAFRDGQAQPMSSAPDLDDADNLRVDPGAGLLHVGYGNALAAIDPTTLRVTRRIELAGHPESFQLDGEGRKIYVNVPSAGHIAIVDRVLGKVTATWALARAARNFAMALDESANRLFVATRLPPLLLAYDLRSGEEVDRLSTCGDADGVFIDRVRQQLYVVCGEGFVEVVRAVDGARLAASDRIATARGARTGLFVPELSKLFVAVPSSGGSMAEVRAFKPK